VRGHKSGDTIVLFFVVSRVVIRKPKERGPTRNALSKRSDCGFALRDLLLYLFC
jgi:hypothetical protein